MQVGNVLSIVAVLLLIMGAGFAEGIEGMEAVVTGVVAIGIGIVSSVVLFAVGKRVMHRLDAGTAVRFSNHSDGNTLEPLPFTAEDLPF